MIARTVLFIHGLWLHPASWERWQGLFQERGYETLAPGWPGVGATVGLSRAYPGDVADHGIDDAVDHFGRIIAELPELPVLIGHSFGGLIAERLLGQGRAAAAVAIDPTAMKGVLSVPPSALHAAFPVLRRPANRHEAISLTADQFHYAFTNTLDPQESAELFERWSIPAPGKPLFEAAAANFSRHSPATVLVDNADRGPLLLIAGGRDHTTPASVTKSALKQYQHSTAQTDLIEFPDRGHSLTIDHGWREVAEAALAWLAKHGC